MASQANLVKEPGLKAGADLSAAANQFKAVKLDASGDIILCSVAGELVYGVLYNKPKSGEAAEVVVAGSPKMQADAAINEMDILATSADGQFAVSTPAVGNTDHAFAIAKDAAAAAGEIISGTIRSGITVNQAVS